MANPVDRLVGFFSPMAALKRQQARTALAYYEAAKPSRVRKFRRDTAGPNTQTQQGAVALRTQARHLEQNHDIARGILETLVNNVIGPKGIGIEPQPRRKDDTIHEDYAKQLMEAWRDWQRRPEVTHQLHWARCQRLLCRTWLRDGEAFSQLLLGLIPSLDHGTRVPLSIEMFEPDMVPFLTDTQRNIQQGIERNTWGKPLRYWVHKSHPFDHLTPGNFQDLKTIPFDRMIHIASADRIGQLRGVSRFASVITRLEDIKDYEESERVAAKIAAMLTAYVKRNHPDGVDPGNLPKDEHGNMLPREISLEPGTIIDTLQVGEEIGLIDSKRPNPNLVTFRQGQLKALAAGVGASYSSISRDYDGNYSAQRQEMIEQWVHYATLTDEFVGNIIQPVWEAFVKAAHLSGVIRIPADVVASTADDALYLGQSMPWIDPAKEATAWLKLVQAGFASEVEVIRKRGQNPADVLEQMTAWRKQADEHGLTLSSDHANSRSANQGREAQARAEGIANAQVARLEAQKTADLAAGRYHLIAARHADAQAALLDAQTEHQTLLTAQAKELHSMTRAETEAKAIADKAERDAKLAALELEQEARLDAMDQETKAMQAKLAAAEARAAELHQAALLAQEEQREAQRQIEKERAAIARLEREAAEVALAELQA